MALDQINAEDQAAMRAALHTWRDSGTENPRIPLDVDLDGDELTDAVGLDDAGELVLLSGVALEATVYVSDGSEGS